MLVTNASPGALGPLLSGILAGADPKIAINSVRSMRQQVELTFDQDRAVATIAGLFGNCGFSAGGSWTVWCNRLARARRRGGRARNLCVRGSHHSGRRGRVDLPHYSAQNGVVRIARRYQCGVDLPVAV